MKSKALIKQVQCAEAFPYSECFEALVTEKNVKLAMAYKLCT